MTLQYELWSVEHTKDGHNIQKMKVERPVGLSNEEYSELARQSLKVEDELSQMGVVIVAGQESAEISAAA